MNSILRVISVLLTLLVTTLDALPRKKIEPKIVGGVEARRGEFPFIIGIRRPSDGELWRHGCGASIINNEWVISAAHCTQGAVSTYELVAGDHYNEEVEPSEQRRNATQIINHPKYRSLSNDFDISLIQVSPPFDFNEFVQPISLAPNGFVVVSTDRLTVAGWGRLKDGGLLPTVLLKVEVPYVTDEQCRLAYGVDRIKDAMICAGQGGKDACKGDSGGPLICKNGDKQVLCGIVSFGEGCAEDKFPGVYSEVSYYEDWVKSVIIASQRK